MQDATFTIPVGSGFACAKLYRASGDEYGLTLHDGSGHPMGNGRLLSKRQAQTLAAEVQKAKPHMLKSLIWAALGYGRQSRKALASGMCHPGSIKFHGRP